MAVLFEIEPSSAGCKWTWRAGSRTGWFPARWSRERAVRSLNTSGKCPC